MDLDQTTMGVIGILAGILILSGWVPQIVKGYKTKKLEDVSAYLMILIFAEYFLRGLYHQISKLHPAGGFFLWMILA